MVYQVSRDPNPIKDELIINMRTILGAPAPGELSKCEERIKMLQVTEGFAMASLEISCDISLDFSLRQLALVLLKQYVTVHWKSTSSCFSPPECAPSVRNQIRPSLLAALGQQTLIPENSGNRSVEIQEKQLRTSLGAVVTAVAIHDWPEDWPELLHSLTYYLCSNNRLIVYGAVKVFVDLSQDINEHQLAHISPIVLPKIYEIFIQPSNYHIKSRCLVLKVFTNLCETFAMLQATGSTTIDDLKKTTLDALLPKMIEALIEGLRAPPEVKLESNGETIQVSDLELKNQIIKCLNELLGISKRSMVKYLDNLLPIIWSTVTSTAAIYMEQIVDAKSSIPQTCFNDTLKSNDKHTSVTESDEDGECILVSLIRSLISFVTELIESKKLREKHIIKSICDLIYHLIIYMMITDEQMHLWNEDPDQFIIDEDEESLSSTVRNETFELLTTLCEKYTDLESSWSCINAAGNSYGISSSHKDAMWYWKSAIEAIKRHFQDLNNSEQQGQEKSLQDMEKRIWKLQESCLLAIGIKPDSLIELVKVTDSEGVQLSTDLMSLLMSSLQNANDSNPFLTGRILMTSSRYVSIMDDKTVEIFLRATLNGLCNQSDVLKICATRAVQTFCFYLNSDDRLQLMSPISENLLDRLVQIGLGYSIDVLSVVLEAIHTMVSSDDEFAQRVEPKVTPMLLASIMKCETSQSILATIKDIIESILRANKAHYAKIELQLLGPLLSLLSFQKINDNNDEDETTVASLRPAILDILRIMILESPLPLSQSFIHQAFPLIVRAILQSHDETALIQSGGETIRCLVSRASDQLAQVRFSSTDLFPDCEMSRNQSPSVSGTEAVLRVCLHLLDPKSNETCCMYIGRLVSVYIRKACQYLRDDDKQLLLRSVLTKLQSTRMLTVEQSLLVIFAHLINYDHNSVTQFLAQLPAPTGSQSAFDYVIIEWLNRQNHFFGKYDVRVSLFALCTLMENSFQKLNQLKVPLGTDDDSTVNGNSTSITTRSKAKTETSTTSKILEWTTLPASVKILRILIDEYWNFIHDDSGDADDSETDYDDDDYDEEDGENEDDNDFVEEQDGGTEGQEMMEQVQLHSTILSDSKLTCGSNDFKARDLLYMSSVDFEEDDADILEDPLTSVSMKERLATFLVRFRSSPYVNDFLPHLTAKQKSILEEISV